MVVPGFGILCEVEPIIAAKATRSGFGILAFCGLLIFRLRFRLWPLDGAGGREQGQIRLVAEAPVARRTKYPLCCITKRPVHMISNLLVAIGYSDQPEQERPLSGLILKVNEKKE
jgi:hypothetical protein